MSWVAVAVGAGSGLVKSYAIDQPRADRERKLAASTQQYSPWTGLKANAIHEANPFGDALQFGATGASMKVGMDQAELNKKLGEKLLNSPNAHLNFNWAGGNGGYPMGGSPMGWSNVPTSPGGTDGPWSFNTKYFGAM